VKTRLGSLPGEGNLPIETVTALNAKTAKAPALTVPPSMVLRADEVIESPRKCLLYGSAPRRRESSVEEDSTRIVVD
jgi:hypothetical protein